MSNKKILSNLKVLKKDIVADYNEVNGYIENAINQNSVYNIIEYLSNQKILETQLQIISNVIRIIKKSKKDKYPLSFEEYRNKVSKLVKIGNKSVKPVDILIIKAKIRVYTKILRCH